MKKVFVTLLMLMMVVGLFATEIGSAESIVNQKDTVTIKAEVKGKNAVAFTKNEYKGQEGDSDWLVVTDTETTLTETNNWETEFWTSVKTNHASPITVKVYATGLAKDYDSKTVALNIKNGEQNVSFDAMPSSNYATSGVDATIAGDGKVLTFKEDGKTTGLRAFSNKLEISADGLKTAEAGNYSAYITMLVE